MARKNYFIELLKEDGYYDKRAERIIRNFLINKCGIIQFEKGRVGEFGYSRKFNLTLESLKQDFLKEEKIKGFIFKKRYYWYKFSSKIKALINQESLFFQIYSKNFYGLCFPAFYTDKEKIADINGFEFLILLYLTDQEKKLLEKNKIKLQKMN